MKFAAITDVCTGDSKSETHPAREDDYKLCPTLLQKDAPKPSYGQLLCFRCETHSVIKPLTKNLLTNIVSEL